MTIWFWMETIWRSNWKILRRRTRTKTTSYKMQSNSSKSKSWRRKSLQLTNPTTTGTTKTRVKTTGNPNTFNCPAKTSGLATETLLNLTHATIVTMKMLLKRITITLLATNQQVPTTARQTSHLPLNLRSMKFKHCQESLLMRSMKRMKKMQWTSWWASKLKRFSSAIRLKHKSSKKSTCRPCRLNRTKLLSHSK